LVLAAGCSRCGPPHLDAVGPRIVSNQTAYPVMLYGERFTEGMRLQLGPPYSTEVPCALVDKGHATALLPATKSFATGGSSEAAASAKLVSAQGQPGEGEVKLAVIDDVGFPQPTGLIAASDGKRAFAVSPTTDEVWVYHLDGAPVERIPVGDGPRALGLTGSAAGERLVVAHEFAAELRLLDAANPGAPQKTLPVAAGAIGLAVDAGLELAFVANHRSNSLQAVNLATGAHLADFVTGVRPQALAIGGPVVVVANAGTGDVSVFGFDDTTGPSQVPAEHRIQPRPGTSIVGGHTEK
jgi:DNA-binding beta-propeller fold protein YncE